MNPSEALGHLTRALLRGARPPEEEPRRPEGVRARVGDQFIEPVELTYAGIDENGTHEWVALFDIDPDTVDGMHLDLLPGLTSVSFAFPIPPEDSP